MKRNVNIPYDLCLKLSPELRLILAILSQGDEKRGVPVFRKTVSDVDWERFLELSDQHGVGPLIFNATRHRRLTVLPERINQALAAQHKTNVFLTMNLSDALCRLAEEFQEAGIPMLSLKGPALAQALFGDISLRLSSDLDILVPVDHLDSVEVLLEKMGYRGAGRNRFLTERQKKLFQKVHHHRTFAHSETGIKLEVHWRLSRLKNRFMRERPFDRLWLGADQILLDDVPIPTLGSTDNFLYLCFHGAYHQWSRLAWLVDVHEILKKWSEPQIKTLLFRHGGSAVGDVMGQALILLDLLFGTDYTVRCRNGFDFTRAVKLASMIMPFLDTSETAKEATLFSGHMYRIIVYMFVLLRENADRIQYINGLLMPTDLEIQTLSIPDKWFPLYFLLHPVCTIYRSMAKTMGLSDPFASSKAHS
jgi:hypothetical protein